MIESLNLGFKRVLAGTLDSGQGIDVRGHVDVVGARLGAGFENRMVGLPGARVERDGDLRVLQQIDELLGLKGVHLVNLEAAVLDALAQFLSKRRIDVRKEDSLETIVTVQLQADDGTDPTHADDHCSRHTLPSHSPVRVPSPERQYKASF